LEDGAQPVYSRKRMPSKLDALKPVIDQWLAAQPGLLATRVHQDLVRDYGFEGSYNTVRRYVERSRPKPPARSEARFETRPGFQAQVDWSHEQPIRTSSGLELPLYCFHMVLGHSRDSFCRLTGSQDLVTFWACHRAAFTHFGGVPHELLYDRTKTVVRQHVGRDVTIEERIFHPEALASAHHYGFSMRLCQAYRAKTKGKVEHDVSWVRERLFRGHSFTSYEDANIAWLAWNEEIARQRVHGTHGEIVAVRAERDHAALLPLPPTSYVVVDRTTRVVARDGFFSFEGRRYHVPDAKPGERVELVLGATELEVHSLLDGRRIARHERGRPARVLPDPVEDSVSLAQVLSAFPDPEVHHRPLSRYEEAIDG
jgi:transposase